MKLNDLNYMISLINDDILLESERKITNRYLYYKKIVVLATSACIILGTIILFVPFIIHNKLSLHNKFSVLEGSTLPGATEINPAVMYEGTVYYWKHMGGTGKGALPDGFEYVGDIENISNEKLKQDLQFTAKFKATGQLYYNKNEPDNVYILITTDWIENAYVLFSKENDQE